MSTLPAAWLIDRLNSTRELSKEMLTPTTSDTPRTMASTVMPFLNTRLGTFLIAILVNDDCTKRSAMRIMALTAIPAAIPVGIAIPKTIKRFRTGAAAKSANDWNSIEKKLKTETAESGTDPTRYITIATTILNVIVKINKKFPSLRLGIFLADVYASLSSVLKSNEAATAVFRTIVTPSRLRISPVYVQYCPAHS